MDRLDVIDLFPSLQYIWAYGVEQLEIDKRKASFNYVIASGAKQSHLYFQFKDLGANMGVRSPFLDHPC